LLNKKNIYNTQFIYFIKKINGLEEKLLDKKMVFSFFAPVSINKKINKLLIIGLKYILQAFKIKFTLYFSRKIKGIIKAENKINSMDEKLRI
jgi:hypothetical protein